MGRHGGDVARATVVDQLLVGLREIALVGDQGGLLESQAGEGLSQLGPDRVEDGHIRLVPGIQVIAERQLVGGAGRERQADLAQVVALGLVVPPPRQRGLHVGAADEGEEVGAVEDHQLPGLRTWARQRRETWVGW